MNCVDECINTLNIQSLLGEVNALNAKEFGEYIQLLQHALYLDIPDDVASKTEDSLNKSKSSFSDGVLLHKFLFDKNQEFTYSVEIILNKNSLIISK